MMRPILYLSGSKKKKRIHFKTFPSLYRPEWMRLLQVHQENA